MPGSVVEVERQVLVVVVVQEVHVVQVVQGVVLGQVVEVEPEVCAVVVFPLLPTVCPPGLVLLLVVVVVAEVVLVGQVAEVVSRRFRCVLRSLQGGCSLASLWCAATVEPSLSSSRR